MWCFSLNFLLFYNAMSMHFQVIEFIATHHFLDFPSRKLWRRSIKSEFNNLNVDINFYIIENNKNNENNNNNVGNENNDNNANNKEIVDNNPETGSTTTTTTIKTVAMNWAASPGCCNRW